MDKNGGSGESGSGGGGGPWGSPPAGGGGNGNSGGNSGGGGGNGPRTPWGRPQRPGGGNGGGGGGGGRRGPDFEHFIRRGQERLRKLPGGNGPGVIGWWIAAALIALWIVMTSFYRVDPAERGVVMRLGKYVDTTMPGVHLKLPAPIDSVVKLPVEAVNSVDIGVGGENAQNLMLTGDQNIIDIAYAVRWKIKDPELYLFELAEPDSTIREVAESAMRAQISSVNLNAAIGPQRATIADRVRDRMQELLDSYNSGIEVLGVDIKQADPPQAVDDAFKDVSAAQQDAQKYLNEANTYAQQVSARAQGEAAAFDAVYAQYRLSPTVTRKRMYYETMEDVLAKTDKTIVETPGVTPYLPLPEIKRRTEAGQ